MLTAHFKGKRVQIPVKVRGAGEANSPSNPASPSVSFLRDVLPALSKAGCNAGACHAKPDGQNGFRLSVFSYDPKSDYAEIVKENRGRRIFPAAPDESLIIKKPTTALPHEGGLRFERGSETHRGAGEGPAGLSPGEARSIHPRSPEPVAPSPKVHA